eukprot:scaffold106482_cov64-Attheya_sp.AAC.1
MVILLDTNERSKLNVVLERRASDVILDSSVSVLMPQARASQGGMFYLESIHSVDVVEQQFLENYHSDQNKILFLNNRKNDSTDQAPTIDEQIETYLLKYMHDNELGYVQCGSNNDEKSTLEDAVKCVVFILRFSQKHRHTLQMHSVTAYKTGSLNTGCSPDRPS